MILAIRELPPPHIDGGTEPGTGENPDDTWTEITSLDGLEGTWESQYVEIERAPNGGNVLIPFTEKYVYPVSNVNLGIENGVKIVEIQDLTEIVRYFTATEDVTESFAWNKIKEEYQGESFEFTDSAPYEVKKTYYRDSIFTENRVIYVNQSEVRVKITEKNTTLYLPPTQPDGELNRVDNEVEWEQYKEYRTPLPEGDKKVTFSAGAPYTEITTQILHKTSESTNPGENPDPGTDPNPGTGTEPGTGENPNDTWTEVTSLTGLEGTWLAKGIGTEKDSTTGELRSSPLYVSITYPFSGRNGNGVEIKDGVRVRMIDGLAVEDYIMVPDDFFNFVQKQGVIPFLLPEERESSNVKVNQSKTELKTEVVIIAPETITTKEDWEKINQEGPSLSGDMFLSFVEGNPCTITGTVIFHKVDANTNIGTEPGTGENPDDTWTKITSFDGLDGTWKASYITKVPSGNIETVESVPVELLMAYPYWGTGEEGQEIVNGVGFGIFLNGVGQPTRILSKDELESILKTGTNGGVATELYINSTRTELKEVRSQEAKIPNSNSEPSNGRPIKDDTEWEEYKLRQAPYLPEGDMKTTFSAGAPYTVTTTQILHKQ